MNRPLLHLSFAIVAALSTDLLLAQAPSCESCCCAQPDCDPTDPGASTRPASAQLTDAERAALLFMCEEEKLAHDVYVALGKRFDLMPFRRIPDSETRHVEAMRGLLDRYGIADPTKGQSEGRFTDPAFQTLYDDLVARGSVSAVAALSVGAEIEELDIADLRRLAGQTTRDDIRSVFGQLERASGNHLRAFDRNLRARDVTYVAKHLPQREYDALLDEPASR